MKIKVSKGKHWLPVPATVHLSGFRPFFVTATTSHPPHMHPRHHANALLLLQPVWTKPSPVTGRAGHGKVYPHLQLWRRRKKRKKNKIDEERKNDAFPCKCWDRGAPTFFAETFFAFLVACVRRRVAGTFRFLLRCRIAMASTSACVVSSLGVGSVAAAPRASRAHRASPCSMLSSGRGVSSGVSVPLLSKTSSFRTGLVSPHWTSPNIELLVNVYQCRRSKSDRILSKHLHFILGAIQAHSIMFLTEESLSKSLLVIFICAVVIVLLWRPSKLHTVGSKHS